MRSVIAWEDEIRRPLDSSESRCFLFSRQQREAWSAVGELFCASGEADNADKNTRGSCTQ